MADLGMHFPELADASAAEKAWRLTIVRLATRHPVQSLSAAETEQKLDGLLTLIDSELGPEGKHQLGEFPKLKASSKVALAQCGRELDLLAGQANSIYRPVIQEYARIASLLGRGKTNGAAERLARVSERRKSGATRMREIADYINWFEAMKSARPSGAFADYMKAADAASESDRRRRDAISIYLDVLETQFHN
jgi:hypothetical protein